MRAAIRHLLWLARHPDTRGRRLAACADWLRWQVASRAFGRRSFRWVDGLQVAAQPGLHGVTANIGVGLAEAEAMSFLLHFLRPGDRYLDIGANAGSFTLLAASRGAQVVAVEPNPLPRGFLERSLILNGLRAEVLPLAVSAQPGTLRMNLAKDAAGHVTATGADLVEATTLDALAGEMPIALLKIDVENHEAAVMDGGPRALSRAEAAIVETWGDPELQIRLSAAGLTAVHYDAAKRRLSLRHAGGFAQSVVFVRDLVAAQERVTAAPAFQLGRRRF